MRFAFLLLTFTLGCGGTVKKQRKTDPRCNVRRATIQHISKPISYGEFSVQFMGSTFLLKNIEPGHSKRAMSMEIPYVYINKNKAELNKADLCEIRVEEFKLLLQRDDANNIYITPEILVQTKETGPFKLMGSHNIVSNEIFSARPPIMIWTIPYVQIQQKSTHQ